MQANPKFSELFDVAATLEIKNCNYDEVFFGQSKEVITRSHIENRIAFRTSRKTILGKNKHNADSVNIQFCAKQFMDEVRIEHIEVINNIQSAVKKLIEVAERLSKPDAASRSYPSDSIVFVDGDNDQFVFS